MARRRRGGGKNKGRRGRKGYVYLGKRVRDTGKPGLDRAKEYEGILRAVLRDYKAGRISKAKARGRLLLLYRLTYPSRNKKARNLSARTRARLRREIKKAMQSLSKTKK